MCFVRSYLLIFCLFWKFLKLTHNPSFFLLFDKKLSSEIHGCINMCNSLNCSDRDDQKEDKNESHWNWAQNFPKSLIYKNKTFVWKFWCDEERIQCEFDIPNLKTKIEHNFQLLLTFSHQWSTITLKATWRQIEKHICCCEFVNLINSFVLSRFNETYDSQFLL